MTMLEPSRDSASRWSRTWGVVRRALRLELRVYASIGRAIARRPAVPNGATGFAYHKPVVTVLVVFIVMSAVEIPLVDLIVHRWPAVRIPLLALGIWGLTWMIGYLCAYLLRPHTVGPGGIRVRNGLELDIPLAWDDITSVTRRRRTDQSKSPRIVETGDDRMLHIRIQDETNIEIRLERPVTVQLPGRSPKGGEQIVTAVRLWTDQPKEFLAEVRKHL
jgi:hypothetical protein